MQKIKTSIVKYVKIELPIRSEEDDIPNDFPFRTNNILTFFIEHPSGKILNFPKNYKLPQDWIDNGWTDNDKIEYEKDHLFFIYIKMVDTGSYYLLDKNKEIIAQIEEDYVPNESIPGEFGDYIELKINMSNGYIVNWNKKAKFTEFKEFANYASIVKEQIIEQHNKNNNDNEIEFNL